MYSAIDSFVRCVVFIIRLFDIFPILVSSVELVDVGDAFRRAVWPNILFNPPFTLVPILLSEDEIEPVSNPPSFPPAPVKDDILDVKLPPKSPVADFI